MRILMISYHTCPLASFEGKESGGMNVYVLELSKSLGRLGVSVDIITRKQETDSEDIIQVEPNVRVIHLPAGPAMEMDKHTIINFIPQFVASFLHFQKAQHISYDLIHAHYYQSGLIAEQINKAQSPKLPLVMTFHTLGLLKNLVARTHTEQESTGRIRIEHRLVDTADAVITPSINDNNYLMYLYGAKIDRLHRIPPGVDTELFKPMEKITARNHIGADPDKKMLLFVGRIEPLKGIDAILYSLKILTVKNPGLNVCLYIVGGDLAQHADQKPSLIKQLRSLQSILGLSHQVQFIPQKQQSELPYYYNAADVTLLPSHYESFGMSAAESLACGTPVITTNVSGISGTIDASYDSLITTVNNPLHLSDLLAQLLSVPTTYENVKNEIKNIEIQSWKKTATLMIQTYSSLL